MVIGPYPLNTIITGDARELAGAIPDESVDLIVTDPPFGIGFKYSNGYEDNGQYYMELMRWLANASNRILKPGGYAFVFSSMSRLFEVSALFPQPRLFAACRNFVQMGRPDEPYYYGVPYAFDPVLFWRKGETKVTVGRDWHVGNTANTNNRGLAEAGFHDCPRPLDTIMYMVDNFAPVSGLVCDFFMGSGTTAVAAKVTGRQYIGFEIVAETAELARQRVNKAKRPLPFVRSVQTEMAI